MATRGRVPSLAVLASGLLALVVAPVSAQGGRPDQSTRLEVTVGTTAITFPDPGVLDFDLGRLDHSGLVVSVHSRPANLPWELRLRADAASLGGYGKPLGDILWRTATSTTWTPLTGTEQTVAQGQGDATITVYFRMRLAWAADLPGTYAAAIAFSVVRP